MRIKYYAWFVIIGLFIAMGFRLSGQNPMTLYFMETIPQISQTNPAIQPRANKFISLPSVNQAFSSDLALKDVVQKSGSDWVTLNSQRFNFNNLYKVLGTTTNFNEFIDLNLFGFGFKTRKGYFTFSFAERAFVQSGIPSDIFKIMEHGFPDNSHFKLSTLRKKGIVYKQFSLGYSHELTEKLTIGANIKPLFGQLALMTDIDRLSLYTGRLAWEIVADGKIYSSLPIDVESTPGEFPDNIETRDLEGSDIVNKYGTSFSNPGIAADFGAVYKFNGKWTYSAAINNIGFINWHKDLNNLSFMGNYIFDGVGVDASNKDNIDDAIDDILDSLETVLNYNTDHRKFISGLTPSFYLGASYHLNHAISFGFLSRSILQKQNFRQDFSLSANIQPYSFVALSVSLNQRITGSTFAGLGMTFLLGPLQFYILTDHLPLRYSEVHIDSDKFPVNERMKDVTIMTGINIVFGKQGYRDKPLICSGI